MVLAHSELRYDRAAVAADATIEDACAVTVDKLRFRWPGARADCLSISSFHIERGSNVFLHGPSGSGKSTLLSLLAGVLTPRGGKLRVLEHELAGLTPAMRDRLRADRIGYLFQQFNLLPYSIQPHQET